MMVSLNQTNQTEAPPCNHTTFSSLLQPGLSAMYERLHLSTVRGEERLSLGGDLLLRNKKRNRNQGMLICSENGITEIHLKYPLLREILAVVPTSKSVRM